MKSDIKMHEQWVTTKWMCYLKKERGSFSVTLWRAVKIMGQLTSLRLHCNFFLPTTLSMPHVNSVCVSKLYSSYMWHHGWTSVVNPPPRRPSDLWVASVLLRLFLRLQTPANFRPYVVGVSRRGGGTAAGGVFGRAAAVIGKYISFQRAHSFLFCFCCQRFSFMLGQMTTELKCRAMLSLQQLCTPENSVFFVRGGGLKREGRADMNWSR